MEWQTETIIVDKIPHWVVTKMTSFQVIDPISTGTGVAKTTLGTVNKPSESQCLIEFTPFHKVGGQAPQTINPSGVLNKWTNAGLIGLGYQIIGKNINKATGMSLIPETSSIGSIAKSALIGGALGGFFSEPTPKTITQQSFPTTTSSMVNGNGNYNSGQDSTLGSN